MKYILSKSILIDLYKSEDKYRLLFNSHVYPLLLLSVPF